MAHRVDCRCGDPWVAMDVKREIEGVEVRGRLESVGERQFVQLIQPYGNLSLSFRTEEEADRLELHAADVLDQLYHIASYACDNQPLLRNILELVIRRIDAAQSHASHGQEEPGRDAALRITQREIERFFSQAFPMPVPAECWEQVLRMIAPAREG